MTALLILMPLPIDAVAQTSEGLVEVREPGRGGFWLGLGLGAGGESYDLQPGSGYSNVLYRPTISVRLGGTVSQHLRLGGEVLSWINQNGPATESVSSGLFVAQFYPAASTGFYLKGGLGIGRNAVDFEDGSGVGDTGFAGLVGAGYELRVGRRLYLNPVIDFVGQQYSDGFGGSYRERLVNFGLGILLQTGR
ncbi:MAG TPA: hypothetical protein VIT87_03930 [Gemmatimonadales bacterium]